MTPELWQRLKPLYSAALELPEQGRTGYIEQMCEGDPELRRELHALIDANQSAANTLDPPFRDISLFPPVRNAVLDEGTLLGNRFRIVRHLGSGGMGDVYEAVDLELGPGHVALKTLRPEIAGNPEALARFKDEVLLARKITGPNICRIHEIYLTGSNHGSMPIAFLTMELLEGVTLHEYIEQNSPLPVSEIRRIAEQLCTALCCIHEAGIIHRDLKTRNVMLVPHAGTQKVVVMDFGLARAASASHGSGDTSLAGPAFVVGTPGYMAPEQFEGREAGPPTDIYALGLILYEMATGVQPFAAHTPLAAAIRRSQRPRFASSVRHELPPAWDDIISRCMEYDPAQRFQSAAQLSEALRHPGKVVLRLGNEHRIAVPRTLLIAASLALFAVLCAATWILVRNAQQRKLAPEAAHWYALGMTALREGSYLKATRLLTQVTQRDPTYAVAHAALADAWLELDYTGQAQHEMLLASSPADQRGLSDLERQYVDAVRTTLTRDYSAAAQDYEAILQKLPEGRKADGYVDLGRIYEKGGKVRETVQAYEKAAQLNPDDPAPFLHLGILKSRLRDPKGAEAAFGKAESLYAAESDLEGEAEVTYQRAYAAVEAAHYPTAQQLAKQALGIARQIPSVALEVRSLSQLSSVAYHQDQDADALDYAHQELELARENGLSYWATDSGIRTANALMDKEDFVGAEDALRTALSQAEGDGHPRLEANAELTLASLCNQRNRLDEQISFAQRALHYFKDYGFMNAAANAETLVLRGEREKGNYEQALQAGNQLLDMAAQTRTTVSLATAQELVGTVLLRLQRYPEALDKFQASLHETETLGQTLAYEQTHCANALWRLGRYSEAETMLASVTPAMLQRHDIGASIATIRANIKASQGDNRAALVIAHEGQARFAGLGDEPELYRTIITAELAAGQRDAARTDLARLVSFETPKTPQVEVAADRLLAAELALQTGDAAGGRSLAEGAEEVFAADDLQESAALSAFWAAVAAQKQGDMIAAGALAQKSVDIFRGLSQSWGVPAFHTYLARPDRRQIVVSLAQLRRFHGDSPDELFQ